MKNILVPTDFSDGANNALEYALNFALHIRASVTIMNCIHTIPGGELPLMLISPKEILNTANERLLELVASAKTAYENKIQISGVTQEGLAAEEIIRAAEKQKSDLIIMGSYGVNSPIKWFGSTTTAVMKKTKCPVLAIPTEAKFSVVHKIALAFDFQREPSARLIAVLKSCTTSLACEIDILNIVTPDTTSDMNMAIAGVGLENALWGTNHHFYFKESEDVITELSAFIKNHNTDWLVVIPHEHSFFSSLLQRSTSTQIVRQISIPILSIHD